MNKRVLYKKEIKLLQIAKPYLANRDLTGYNHNVRDAIPDLFYENSFNLKSDFIELIPSEDLSQIRTLLDTLRMISGYCSEGFSCSVHSGFHKPNILVQRIDNLISIMQEQINKNSLYTVFYSWQSDLENKFNRNFIENSIKKAIKNLNEESEIHLILDKDTKDQTGSPDIIRSILNKIDNSIAFICDVSLICSANNKGVVNPNVMFELGYAINSLSDERIIMICNTAYGDLKQLPFDLGLKRQIAYNYSEKSTEEEKRKAQSYLLSSIQDAIKKIRDIK